MILYDSVCRCCHKLKALGGSANLEGLVLLCDGMGHVMQAISYRDHGPLSLNV